MAVTVRRDGLPEGLQMRSACGHSLPCGCKPIAECCLQCPLPICRYDAANGFRTIRKSARDSLIKQRRQSGITIEGIAKEFDIHRRTVLRVLAT